MLERIGYIYQLKKDLKNAKSYFERAVSINNISDSALINLGTIYLQEHNFELAEKYLSLALELGSEKVEVYYYLSQVYL